MGRNKREDETVSIKVSKKGKEKVSRYVKKKGGSIGRFYEIAVTEKLKRGK